MAVSPPTNDMNGFGSGRGKPTFPANYDTGQNLGPGVGYGEELAFTSDIRRDPADTDNDCDPTVGWNPGICLGSQDS